MKDDKEEHVIEKSVEFYANPVYESYYLLSVGEKESFVIINAKEYTGTATLYNTVKEQDPYDPEQYICKRNCILFC